MPLQPANPTQSLKAAIIGTTIPAVLVFGLFVLNVTYVPSARKTFDEYGMTLPLATQGVISFSNWLSEYWWAAFLLFALAGLGNFALLKSHSQRRWAVSGVWIASVASFSFAVFTLAVFWASQGGIRLSNWICENGWVAVPLVALAGVGSLSLLKRRGHRGWVVAGVWIASVSLFFLTLSTLTLLSIEVPMTRLREALAA